MQLVIIFMLNSCYSADNIPFKNNNIYIDCVWHTIVQFDFTPSPYNTGSPIKGRKEYARVDNYEKLNRLVFDKYKSIPQYFAKGKRKIYLRYQRKIDKYGNEKEETEYLCTIDIDELKKYKTYWDYCSGDYGKNSLARAYEQYKRDKGVN